MSSRTSLRIFLGCCIAVLLFAPSDAKPPKKPAQPPPPPIAPPPPPPLPNFPPPPGSHFPPPTIKNITPMQADEETLTKAGLKSDGPSLIEFLRKRTITPAERKSIEQLVGKLGSRHYRVRQKTQAELIQRGPVVLEMLHKATLSTELEVVRRAKQCIERIKETDVAAAAPQAAVRLLAERKPDDAVPTLLAFLPFSDNEALSETVRDSLTKLAVTDGKPHALLVESLKAKDPMRRAAAAEALARADIADLKDVLHEMLNDPHPLVRFHLADALTARDEKSARQSIPVLIDLIPELNRIQRWQVEAMLFRLAGKSDPPQITLGSTPEDHKKASNAWRQWWEKYGVRADVAKLRESPKLSGETVIALLDLGHIVQLDANEKEKWRIQNLGFPLDVQLLPNKRVLVAEYQAGRISERTFAGDIVWEKSIASPLMAQRLANGNTFIASEMQMVEVDPAGKVVKSFTLEAGERIMKAMKLPNGDIACMAMVEEPYIMRLDANGKRIYRFHLDMGRRLFGGRIHMTPTGRVLVPHNAENKVIEYDANGKAVWEASISQPIAAVKLANGHTLVTSMLPHVGAVEFDRMGNAVWYYRDSSNTRVTRALKH